MLQDSYDKKTIPAYAWYVITLTVTTIIQIKTIANFIVDNVSIQVQYKPVNITHRYLCKKNYRGIEIKERTMAKCPIH